MNYLEVRFLVTKDLVLLPTEEVPRQGMEDISPQPYQGVILKMRLKTIPPRTEELYLIPKSLKSLKVIQAFKS